VVEAQDVTPTPRRLDDAESRGIVRLLTTPQFQEGFVIAAIIVGVTLIVNGEFVFKVLCVVACGILGGLWGIGEAAEDLGQDLNIVISYVVGIEIGLGCAYAAYKGIDGVMVASFALFGVFLAYEGKGLLENVSASVGFEDVVNSNKWVVAVWYSFFTLTFMRAVQTKQHLTLLAYLTSLLGGALVSSAISWIFTATARPGMNAEKGAWIEFLMLLVVPGSKDVGIYRHANASWFGSPLKDGAFAEGFSEDRVMGLLIWFFLFAFGSLFQLSVQKAARVSELRQPLLRGA